MAEPENRLRAGIMLFNDSEHHQEVASISKSLGQPEVHVSLGSGEEPPTVLTFTWRDITWRTYNSHPGPAVEEPRVYLEGAGEDLSGVKRKPSNAHIDSGGRVLLGL
jgi:ribonucrease Y